MKIRTKTPVCRLKDGIISLRSPSRAVGLLQLQAVRTFGNMTKTRYETKKARLSITDRRAGKKKENKKKQ